MTNWGYHHTYPISSCQHKWLIKSHSRLLFLFWIYFRDRNRHLTHLSAPNRRFIILDTNATEFLCSPLFFWCFGIPEILSPQFNSLDFNLSSDRSDLIFLLLNLGFIQYLAIYHSISYFWCVIFQFRSRGGRMITSLNWSSTQSESHCLGHLVPILCPHHSGHLITRGIFSSSFWHLCHLLHLMIIWSKLITFLIWVCWTGIGIV